MKLVWIYISLALVLLPVESQKPQELHAFRLWKIEFKKTYPTKKIEDEALKHFLTNLRFIEAHNENFQKGLESSSLGLW